ncbi:MAG: hypothetical protein ACI4BI_00060 [Anaerotardibacter sp.]
MNQSGTVQSNTVQNTMNRNSVQSNTARRSVTQNNTLQKSTAQSNSVQRSTVKRNKAKCLYVSLLLLILPLLLFFGNKISSKIKQETQYLGNQFTFALDITNYGRGVVLKQENNSWKRLPKSTKDVDYIICFRDLDYAFDVFAGNCSLHQALSARLFSTTGPNNKGVSITYLFMTILKTFFFWRKAYRKKA